MAAREVEGLLVGERSTGNSPRIVVAKRDTTSTIYPPEVVPTMTSSMTFTSLALAPTLSTRSTTTTLQTSTETPTSTAVRPTATSEPSEGESDSGELSGTAKAGIVIGALAGLLVLFVLLYLVFSARKRKLERRRQQIEDDEKINGPFADSAAIRPAPNKAPRLSLRPVTQFFPNFNSQSQAERRASRGIDLTLNPVSSTTTSQLNRPTGGSAWERPTVRSTMASPNLDNNRPGTSGSLYPTANPFHDNQRIPDEPVSPISSMGSFDLGGVGRATTTNAPPEPVSPIGGDDDDEQHQIGVASSSGPAASSLTRKTSMRKDAPKPLDLTKPPSPLYAVPPSPAGTEYSMHSMAPGQSPGPSASAAAIAAAGGPAHSTVHRVQLDFKPTLDDEMELRAGQLVRLLHEYDDGWALCIRLDRSEQGVVPRTCLSTRPVKPRAPPQQQQQAGAGPRGGYGRPRSPNGGGRRGPSPG
ncbi:bef9dcb7-8d6e-44a4-89b3-ef6c07518108 [Thermothielavioides terrestris]|nr:bef9dcb7-8d6e-44a4-89b3-ef6c07518108 [Thermothielavioides terrestris]